MSQEKTFAEKRLHPRVAAEFEIQYRIVTDPNLPSDSPERRKERKARTLNVSLGGVYIAAGATDLGIGSILSLNLFLPGNPTPLTAMAETVRRDALGRGLHFLAMKLEDGKALKACLEKISNRR